QEAALQVDVDDAGKFLGLHFFQRLRDLAEDAAGDIDQHIDRAAGRRDDGFDAFGVGDVDSERLHSVASLDLVDQPVAGEDVPAVGGESPRDGAADATGGAGHDHCLAVEADLHQARSSKAVSFRLQITTIETTAATIR